MLRFRDADGTVRVLTDPHAVWAELAQHVRGGFVHFIVYQKAEVLKLLTEWISATGGNDPQAWQLRKAQGQQAHTLEFGDHTNMARALMGEFFGRMALDDSENALGAATLKSAYITAHLRALIDRLRLKLAHPTSPPALKVLLDVNTDFKALKVEYQPLYRNQRANLARVLKDPDAYRFEDLVVTLHDLMSAVKKLAPQLAQVPASRCEGTYFRINDLGEPEFSRRPIQTSQDFRYKDEHPGREHFTLKEGSGFVQAARVQGMPIWAGPSFTTARMMFLAEWAGATAEELEALAWGIFGFWNQCYPTSSTWVHRFHEVMDMAANWGVPFEPFVYPRGVPPSGGSKRSKL